MTRRWSRRLGVAGTVALVLLVASCGLPDGGSVTRVDDETVPYGLLDGATATPGAGDDGRVPGPVPLVYWLIANDRLVPEVPEAGAMTCAQPSEAVVERLLGDLTAGPTDAARAAGRSTALPPELSLVLVGVSQDTAEVELDPDESSSSADRLPGAVGQIVLTVTSAPGVRAVALVSDGEPVQVPLPGGALTGEPVTAEDYASLLPDRHRGEDLGCPA